MMSHPCDQRIDRNLFVKNSHTSLKFVAFALAGAAFFFLIATH